MSRDDRRPGRTAEPPARAAPAPVQAPTPARASYPLRVGGSRAVQLEPGARPTVVFLADSAPPWANPGPQAFAAAITTADLGVCVSAVEVSPSGAVLVAVSAVGRAPAVLSPGDVLGVIPAP